MVDRKISSIELEKNGLIKDGIEYIPPFCLKKKTQAYMRSERRISYFKICGRIYYNESDLIAWAQKQKVNIAS
ncbi:MAG: hypothetical protein RBR12_10360 [Sulfurospirillum cavolei]|uniref:hypothetical protein n=1 Tax=Sulfurospirillum sp. UCH001 TaxID=1581011 RepID=UPI00082F4463|nr:hypothetical protein [Sulfurospirillum sp. UCH001]MDY0265568.1 hypothetical protein [Sulfurospirillum cavolei]